jgi:hypothetical protein
MMRGQTHPRSTYKSAPQVTDDAAFEQLLVVFDQDKWSITVVTSLNSSLAVPRTWMSVKHDGSSV